MSREGARFFTHPQQPVHRLYEALRCYFVEERPMPDVARRFGYAPGTLYVQASHLRQGKLDPFFRTGKTGPASQPKKDIARERIFELRKRNCSVYDIHRILAAEGRALSVRGIWEILHQAGFARLPRRLDEERLAYPRPEAAAVADRREFGLAPDRFRTELGGAFLFLPLLAKLDPGRICLRAKFPGTQMIPSLQSLLSLLLLKLVGRERISHVMDVCHDRGAALFVGLNAIPKTTALTTYSYRVTRPQIETFLHELVGVARREGLVPGNSFNLDFHSIPHFGEESVLERHYVPRRSHAEKAILTFLAQDGDTRALCYSKARLLKRDQADEVLRFAEFWKKQNRRYPKELVFDSKLTTIANLSKLNRKHIHFLTLRSRSPSVVRRLLELPEMSWTRCELEVPHRKYRFPSVLDQRIQLKDYDGEIRQIAAKNLGRELPTLLITNNFRDAPAALLTRYAQRMLIENAIADGVHFFHLDALCSGVQIEVDYSVALTILANVLYRWFANKMRGFERVQPKQVYRKFIHTWAEVRVRPTAVEVILPRRSHNPLLLEAGYNHLNVPIPWWNGATLKFSFR
jgi:transposase-like protein